MAQLTWDIWQPPIHPQPPPLKKQPPKRLSVAIWPAFFATPSCPPKKPLTSATPPKMLSERVFTFNAWYTRYGRLWVVGWIWVVLVGPGQLLGTFLEYIIYAKYSWIGFFAYPTANFLYRMWEWAACRSYLMAISQRGLTAHFAHKKK